MTTMTAKLLPIYEKVIHIAFGCGCVESFHVERGDPHMIRCPKHGDFIASTTEEYLPKESAA